MVKNPPPSARDVRDGSLTPWRREWQPTPVFLPGESHAQRDLVGCSPRGHKDLEKTEHAHTGLQRHIYKLKKKLSSISN